MAGERKLIVQIVGDDKSLQAAFARSTASTKAFAASTSRSLSGGVSVGKSFEPLLGRVKESQAKAAELSRQLEALDDTAAGAGSGTAALSGSLTAVAARAGLAGLAINALYQGTRHLQDALEETGTEAFTTEGKLRNLAAALLSGDIIGGLGALRAAPKTLEDLGISVTEASNRMDALQKVADGTAKSLREQGTGVDANKGKLDDYSKIVDEAGTGNRKLAQELINQVAALQGADNATNALADSTARLGTVFRDTTGQAVIFKGAVDDLGGPRGPGAVDAINAALEQAAGGFSTDISPGASRAAKETIARASGDLEALLGLQKADRAAAQKALDESKAVGKDREALNQTLADTTAAVIITQNQIKAQNTATQGTVKEVEKADPAAAWTKIIDGLKLGVDRAGLTKNLNDDLARLRDLQAGLQRQVKAGVEVASAQSQLVTVAGQIADKQQEIRDKLAAALQTKQFRELGLSGAGEEIIPGPANLAKRLKSALAQVDSGDLDISSKLVSHLRAAQRTIAKEGDKLTAVTRDKINEWLKAATGAAEKGATDLNHTLEKAINRNQIVKGLDLDPRTAAVIKSRLQGFNTAGRALAPPKGAFGAFGIPLGAGGQPINVTTTVVLDGQAVGRSVTKHQQNAKRSNPAQKRGPHAGI